MTDNNTIKPGMRIINGATECTVLLFTENGRRNLALLIRADGMFITVNNLSIFEGFKTYSWDFGHYFTDIRKAVVDYDGREKNL